ncbi:MAG TPA: transglutaminase-like domain-containing protein [Bacteroidales bacterium]|nr:transglutaminase-like domain-containing protein [Bacteroidales bacterium]HQI71068.1 transglutaminase-like domain-containing protein [Bacteroidales bacterium]
MTEPGKNKELEALVNLIDEPDETIYRKIRERILLYGKEAVPYLEQAWEVNVQPLAQKRIETLLHKMQFGILYDDLNNWYSLGGHNLLMAYLLVSKFHYPALDEQKIKKELDRIKKDIWLEMNSELTAFEKVNLLNNIIYTENNFEAVKHDDKNPLHYYLNNLLETRKGNHLSLAMLYLIIANHAEMPVFGVDLPEHFILAYMKELAGNPDKDLATGRVFFYIDPYDKGELLGAALIDEFLKSRKYNPIDQYYKPCTNIAIIKRLLNELFDAYKSVGNAVKCDELSVLLTIFK